MNHAKVDDHDGAGVQDKDVAGLDVSMDDAPGMRGLQTVCSGNNDIDYSFNGDRFVTVNEFVQRLAPEKGHDEIWKLDVAVPKLAAIGYRDNIRMLQVCQNPPFPIEKGLGF